MAWHRGQGHIPLICSGSSQFAVLQVADELQIQHTIYTEWEAQDGYLTGTLRHPLVYGTGKVFWAQAWADANQIDLAGSYFYSDHISDLPLMDLVAHPVAINPDKKAGPPGQSPGLANPALVDPGDAPMTHLLLINPAPNRKSRS